MTDERLAEIERAVFDVEGWPVNCSEELLQALKAERAEAARLESPALAARVKAESELASVKASLAYLALMKRAEAAESKLRAVGELRRFNVNIPKGPAGGLIVSVVSASELAALLK